MKTTLNAQELRDLNACENGYDTFFEAHGESTVTLTQAFESNGWGDIWWYISEAYESFSDEQKRDLRLLACDYAEDVLHIFEDKHPHDKRPREAIEVSRKYALGEVGAAARDAAGTAAGTATRDTGDAWAAGDAARDAGAAARDAARAAWAAKKAWQEEKLKELFLKWERRNESNA